MREKLSRVKQFDVYALKTLILFISSVIFIGCGGNGGVVTPPPTKPDTIAFNAWVGKEDSLVTIQEALPNNSQLYSFRNHDCDINNINACDQGQNLMANSQPITDPAFTLSSPAYYQLKNGNTKSAYSIGSVSKLPERTNHQFVEFQGQLWFIGGFGGYPDDTPKSDVWSSLDGTNWVQRVSNAPFGSIYRHKVVNFKKQLWLFSNDRKNAWTSDDGINWTQVIINTNMPARPGGEITAFKNKLWIIGGELSNNDDNSVWSSEDGINWAPVTANANFSARKGHQVIAFNNKLWVIGGHGLGNDDMHKNDVWSSEDGVNWTPVTEHANFPARSDHQVISFNNKLLLVGGEGEVTQARTDFRFNDIWSSSDGFVWTPVIAGKRFSARGGHQVVAFKNQLWLSGGNDIVSYKNDIWASSNGRDWRQTNIRFGFSPRSFHQTAIFNDQLWVIGGLNRNAKSQADIWTSNNGINWTNITFNAAFSGLHSHQVTEFNDQLWIIGGSRYEKVRNGGGTYNKTKNDIWRSDDGSSWKRVTTNPTLPARQNHQVTEFKGQLWIIGGEYYKENESRHLLNDIWTSSNGIDWVNMTENADFSARSGHQVVVFNNQLWLIGGEFYGEDQSYQHLNDIWTSSNGIDWTQVETNTVFPARSHHQAIVFNDKIWVIGGSDDGRKNDVWSSDNGIDWNQVEVNAEFPGIAGHQVKVWDNKLWLIGGDSGRQEHDVWQSTDGKNWRKGYSGTIYK